ncbi:hypothetical protein BZG36_02896 [Bifiguratus adelaidae]|uniref:Mediator of RNA polymerase II transcription subunit 20 n=1 Tax=Bifiguratus adelaidae TaxID=1938954 RepID=A0A261Y1Z5_9FUNG|nr:hypothetical protein BZG36_02896 [Bifiguratus adelaidae]
MVEGGVLVAADRELDTILGKLKNCWAVRQTIIVEGAIFEVGDFTLRIANLLLGQAYKGLLLEIEYGPATAPNSALGPIQNFLQAITPSTAQLSYETTYDYRSVGLSDTDFSAAHTGYQYMSFLKREGLL